MTHLHFCKIWPSSLSERFSLSFSSHYSRVNSPSSTSQPLSGGTLSTTPSNFRLTPSGGIINSSTSFRVVVIFVVGHFITTPLLYENVGKFSAPLLISPPSTVKHKRVHRIYSTAGFKLKFHQEVVSLGDSTKHFTFNHQLDCFGRRFFL